MKSWKVSNLVHVITIILLTACNTPSACAAVTRGIHQRHQSKFLFLGGGGREIVYAEANAHKLPSRSVFLIGNSLSSRAKKLVCKNLGL